MTVDTAPEETPTIPTEDHDEPRQSRSIADLAHDLGALTKDISKANNLPIALAHTVVKTALDFTIAQRSLSLQEMAQMPQMPFNFVPPAPIEDNEAEEATE